MCGLIRRCSRQWGPLGGVARRLPEGKCTADGVISWRRFWATQHTHGRSAPEIWSDADAQEEQKKDKKFIDRRRVMVTAGDGGAGAVSFAKDGGAKGRRGADGGNGGDGADVWVRASRGVKSLGNIPYRAAGKNGGKGAAQGANGRRGDQVELEVPVGTVVWRELDEGNERTDTLGGGGAIDFSNWGSSLPVENDEGRDDTRDERSSVGRANFGERPRGIHKGEWEVLTDLSEHGARFRLARGGRGGKGNRSKPTGKDAGTRDLGEEGEKLTVVFELKSVADVGLVGLPNAGKSTLLRAVSGARPKVAGYAFTTMHPQLGTVATDGGISSMTVADIPGLIEGAHMNRGLGHNFLRHVERCSAFAFVVDLSAGAGDTPGMRPWEALEVLKMELEAYLPGLSDRPAIVVGTKTDLPHAADAAAELRRRTKLPVLTVSAHEARGIDDLVASTEAILSIAQEIRKSERETCDAYK